MPAPHWEYKSPARLRRNAQKGFTVACGYARDRISFAG